MKTGTKVFLSIIAVFVVLLVLGYAVASHNSGNATTAKESAVGPVAPARGSNSLTTTQTLVGVPAEIDALGDAAKRTGGKVNGLVILDARKKLQDNLPPKPESQRATEAKRVWEGLKRERDFLHGCVLQNRVQFGPNDGTTAKSKRSEYEAALAATQARDDYAEILRSEGFSEAQIKEKIEGR